MLRILTAISVILCVFARPRNDTGQISTLFPTVQVIQSEGYAAEAHKVTTEDGYILEMHRIPFRRHEDRGDADRPVILLMHGLLSASNAFIILGPEYSIAYNLADAGFDVWMGNARGNKNSRAHVTLDPDDPVEKFQFFDYTWEEVGLYDIPAMVDYILEYTGNSKLHYIGHSQGGTVFLVLNSMRVEYNEKFASAHLLAGVGYQEYFPDEELASTASMTDIIYSMAVASGTIEMYPPEVATEASSYSRVNNCVGDVKHQSICELIGVRKFMRSVNYANYVNDTIDNTDTDNVEDTDSSNEVDDADAVYYDPGGGSLKQVAHFGQNIRDKAFRRYHHGLMENLDIYGSTNPPAYNLSLITVNVTMHYTVNDNLVDERDVLAMAADMPNTIVRKVARDTFLHADFAAAIDAKELVTVYIIEAINGEAGIQSDESNIDDELDDEHLDAGDEDVVDDDQNTGLEDGPSSASSFTSIYFIVTGVSIYMTVANR